MEWKQKEKDDEEQTKLGKKRRKTSRLEEVLGRETEVE